MEIETTKKERELLDHALGERKASKRRKAASLKDCYRNYFAASPNSGEDLLWQGLVSKNLAERISTPRTGLPYNIYCATEAGLKELG